MIRDESSSIVSYQIYVDEEFVGEIESGSSIDTRRLAKVRIFNSHYSGINFTFKKIKLLGGGGYELISTEKIYIPYRGTYSFTMTSDIAFDVWTTGSSGGGNTDYV